MSHISLPKLAELTGHSRRQLQRLATAGDIPGASRKKGGHWQVENSPALKGWISYNRMKIMSRESLTGHKRSRRDNEVILIRGFLMFIRSLNEAGTTRFSAAREYRDLLGVIHSRLEDVMFRMDEELGDTPPAN